MSDTCRSPKEVLALCRKYEISAVDLRFTDFCGKHRHVTVPVEALTESRFEDGFGFDGSAIPGWQAIHESDMLIVPVPQTAFTDPYMQSTVAMLCSVRDPVTHQPYPRDPRNIAQKAEIYMQSTGIADRATVGADVDFYVFDDVRFEQSQNEAFFHIESGDGEWSRGKSAASGHIPYRSGYQVTPPLDQFQSLRTNMMVALLQCGVEVASHHREVASGGQNEVSLMPAELVAMSDRLMRLKYIVRNAAVEQNKVATFMPKPIFGDNGSGLHLQLSLWKDDQPLFSGSGYGGLSETAMHAMGGILKHAGALLAFCCPTTNSYKRLVPGFDAPINLSYSYRNRSAAIRIPANSGDETRRRLEFRCPDSSCNPYLANSAILMAMLDGIQNRMSPGQPLDKDLYDLEPEEQQGVPSAPRSLEDALAALESDCDFLLRGDVFTKDVVDNWIEYKRLHEVEALRQRPHPYEFAMYFDS